MPRRPRNPFRNPRNAGGPPKPIAMVAPVVDVNGLKRAFDWMPFDRIVGCKLAFEWYAANMMGLLFGDPLDAERQADYERGNKAKIHGDGSPGEAEKIQAYRTALRKFDKVFGTMPDPKVKDAAKKGVRIPRGLPKVDAALDANELSPYVLNVQTVLSNLNTAFSSAGCKFRITFGDEREFSEGEILLPATELDKLITCAPLKVVLSEVPTVAKVISIVTDADGAQQLDGAKFVSSLPVVLDAVYAWAAGNNNLLKPLAKAVAPARARAAKQPRVPGAPTGPRVAVRPGQTINVINLALVRMKGKRATAINQLTTGDTVAQFKTKLAAMGMAGYTGWAVKTAVDKGAITLS